MTDHLNFYKEILMTENMKKHFVTFYSPGTLISEMTTKEIDSWDVDKAVEMSHDITERYNAIPYGFKFSTKERGPEDFDSKETLESNMYYLGGTIKTIEEIEKEEGNSTLFFNMKNNNMKRVIENTNSWQFTGELKDNDVVLEYTPRERKDDN